MPHFEATAVKMHIRFDQIGTGVDRSGDRVGAVADAMCHQYWVIPGRIEHPSTVTIP